MVWLVILIIAGFLLLIKGADWLVSGASALARKNNISDLAIGLTIVAFGTSAPELVVNLISSSAGHSDIVFGNVIGSNIFNLFIILGLVGLIFPIKVKSRTVWREIPISFLAAALFFLMANLPFFRQDPGLSRLDGGLLFLFFVLFLYYVSRQMRTDPVEPELIVSRLSGVKIWLLILAGLGGLVLGGRLVVDSAVELAGMLGISQKIIGLTIVAAGTSLPELVTSVIAALRKNSDIAIGNIIGSNIFNVLFILSISALWKPLTYNMQFNTDLYLFLGGTFYLFFAMFSGVRKRLDRWEAGLLLLFYGLYTAFFMF